MHTRLLAVAALPVLAAGCGASASPQVARVGTASTTTGAGPIVPRGGSFTKFVTCMRQHGVNAELGPHGRGVSVQANPGGQAMERAQNACRKYLPGGGPPPLTPAQQAQRTKALLAFAKCMRKHGVPSFPDPGTQAGFFDLPKTGIDLSSPTVRTAFKACESLMNGIRGPRMAIP
jgi:hypothetical protein